MGFLMRKIELNFKIPTPQYQIGTVFKDNLILNEEIVDIFNYNDDANWQLDESILDEEDSEEVNEIRERYSNFKVGIIGYEFAFPMRRNTLPNIIVNHFFDNGMDDDIAIIDLTKFGKYIYLLEPIYDLNDYYTRRHKILECELTELLLTSGLEISNSVKWHSIPLPHNLPIGSTHEEGWSRLQEEGIESIAEYQIVTGYRIETNNHESLLPLINTIFANGDVFNPLIDLVLDKDRKDEYAGDRFEYSMELEYRGIHEDTKELVRECKLYIEILSDDLDDIGNELLTDDFECYFKGKGIQSEIIE